MKKFYYSLFAAATMLLATTSCSQEEDFAQQSSNEKTTFSVSLDGKVGSRAAGDGKKATNLYYEVYLGDECIIDQKVAFENGKLTQAIEMPLLKGEEYDIIFWAQAAEGSIYDATNLKTISVQYGDNNTVAANQEAYDAFYNALNDFKADGGTHTIELRRPFAQLNLGTNDWDWKKAKDGLPMVDDGNGGTKKQDPVTETKVVVKGLANTFSPLTGIADGAVDVTFDYEELPEESTFDVNVDGVTTTYKYLSLNYLLVPGEKQPQGLGEHDINGNKTNVDIEFTLRRGDNDLFTINVPNAPIQRNWRTNVIGDLLTGNKFEVVIKPETDGDHNIVQTDVATNEDLEAALRQDEEYIVIDLSSNSRAAEGKTYTVKADYKQKESWGSENTKTITINANGNTIEFNHIGGDWSGVSCVNPEAKVIINDATITNTGNNGSAWNKHNIIFFNAVQLNNVTSDKAIALMNDGKLTNVAISDDREDSDDYGLWIASQGQTVELDGCTFNMIKENENTGRGIAIKDQYVDEPESVTLTVKNTTFQTEAKAAIMVTSTVGADITLENLDLSGVKADQFNAVWVDANSKDYADKVIVEGGSVIIEGDETAENPFMIEGNTVKVAKGVYGTLPNMANGVTIEAEEGTVFTGTSSVAGKNVTIKNVRFVNENDVKALTGNLKDTNFENCTFESEEGARWCFAYGDVVFTNCTFGSETSKRGVHFDDGDGNVTFNNCDFYSFNALGNSIHSYKFNECDIKVSSNSSFNGVNMYGTEYEYTNCSFEPGTYTDCAEDKVIATYTGCSYTDNSLITSVIRFDRDASTCTVTFDGKQINFVNKAASIAQAADNSELYLVNGKYDMPSLPDKTITLIGQSKDKTILNMLKTGGNNPQYSAKSLTYKNLTVNRPISIYQGVNAESENYENCILKGLQFLYSNEITYTNCDFDANGAEHCSWTYGANEVSFTGCTFTYGDRAVNCYSDQSGQKTKATFNDCQFNKVAGKPTTGALETNSSLMTGLDLNIHNCNVNEGDLWWVSSYDKMNGAKTVIKINGEQVFPVLVAFIGTQGYTSLDAALAAAVNGNEVIVKGGEYHPTKGAGKNITITAMENEEVIFKLLNQGEDGCDYGFGGNVTGVGTYVFNNITFDTTENNRKL